MKAITPDHPDFDRLFTDIVEIMQNKGMEIDNIEGFKTSIAAIDIVDNQIRLRLREEPSVAREPTP